MLVRSRLAAYRRAGFRQGPAAWRDGWGWAAFERPARRHVLL